MKDFLGALRMELSRGIINPLFLLCAAGTAALLFAGILNNLIAAPQWVSIYNISTTFQDGLMEGILVLSIIPLGASFCADCKNQFLRPALIRAGSVTRYSAAKTLAVAVTGGLTTALGYAVFYLSLSSRFPFLRPDSPEIAENFRGESFPFLLQGHHYALFLLFQILLQFACSALFSVLALCFSTVLPNVFVTLFSPVLLYYVLACAGAGHVATYLSVYSVFHGRGIPGQRGEWSTLYAVALTAVLCLMLTFFIRNQVRRRLQHA